MEVGRKIPPQKQELQLLLFRCLGNRYIIHIGETPLDTKPVTVCI